MEESDRLDVRAAVEEHKRLSTEVFPDLKLGLLHGRLSSRDKDKSMRQFRDGELDILVATAVVEVGIDVPNAAVMLIDGQTGSDWPSCISFAVAWVEASTRATAC